VSLTVVALLVTVIAFIAAFMMGVSVLILVWLQLASLSHVHVSVLLSLLEGESLTNALHLVCVEGLGELDLEDDEEVAKSVGGLVERHTVVLDSLDVVGLDNFTRLVLNPNLSVIEVGYHEVDSC
jgi:hypothetical protein